MSAEKIFYKGTKFESNKKIKGTCYKEGKVYFITNKTKIFKFNNRDFENICNFLKKSNYIIEEETDKYIIFCQFFAR